MLCETSHRGSGQQALGSVSFPLRTMMPSQAMLKPPSLQCSTSFLFICPDMNFQTPLTAKAHALCNVLRSSEVWGMREKGLIQWGRNSRFISGAWGRKREWWLLGAPQPTNISASVKSNPQPPSKVVSGPLFSLGIYKQYNLSIYASISHTSKKYIFDW